MSKLNQLKQLIDPLLKTLVITNNDDLLIRDLLNNNNFLVNIQFMNIDIFTMSILESNHISYLKPNLLEKHYLLSNDNHQFSNSISFLEDLNKLDKECFLSNNIIESNNEYAKYLSFNKLSLTNLNCLYDQIIVYDNHNLLPIHLEILNNLNIKPIFLEDDTTIKTNNITINTHDNYIELFNHLIDVLNNNDSTFQICIDDLVLRQNLINLLDNFNFKYTNLNNTHDMFNTKITNSISNFILNNDNVYDLFNILDYYKYNISSTLKNNLTYQYPILDNINFNEEIDNFLNQIKDIKDSNSNKEIIEKTYVLLTNFDFINLNKLNDITSDIYVLEYLDKISNDVLITYYCNELNKCFNNQKQLSSNSKIFITDTNITPINIDHLIIIDGAFKSNTDYNTSLLYSLNDRMNNNIITNNEFISIKEKQNQLLLKSCDNIEIYHSLNTLDNKPNELAYFINDLKLKTYHHSINYFYSNKYTLDNKINFKELNVNVITQSYSKSVSSTRLDSYFKCPYKYFINYVLKPNTNYILSAKLGEIQHEVLEMSKLQNFEFVYDDFIMNKLLEINESMPIKNINTLYNRLVDSIKYNLKVLKEILDNTDYHPDSFEQTFELAINDMMLNGKIDALLKYNDHYFVVDFKSSKHSFNQTDFIAGISNQLITYLYLLKENGYKVSGAFYQNMKLDYVKVDSFNDDFNEAIFNEKKLNGILMNDPAYNDHFDKNINNFISYISNVKFEGRKSNDLVKEVEFLTECFSILEDSINKYIKSLQEGNYLIYPYSEASCKYCEYHNICKIDSNFNNYRKGDLNNEQ